MKRNAIVGLVIFTILGITACGTPTLSATEPVATDLPPAASNETEIPASGDTTQVNITLADNTIETSHTSFQVGVPYTLVIANQGRRAHNFNINPPVSVAGSLDAALSNALLIVDQDQLSPGATATVQFTFPESAAGQVLEFSCLIRKHYDDGMLIPITVTK
jgi:uncharacterized cupredoxin-like copper-binding protein